MLDLERYRYDVVHDSLRMEVFVGDLQELFESKSEAMHWLEEFTSCFEVLADEREEWGELWKD